MSIRVYVTGLYLSILKGLREGDPYSIDRAFSALVFVAAGLLLTAANGFHYEKVFALIGLVLLVGVLFTAYVWRTQREFLSSPKNVMLAGIMFILFLILYRFFWFKYWFLIPVSALALMLTLLIGHRIALIEMVLATSLISLSRPISPEKIIFLLFGGVLAIMTSRSMSSWRETARSGAILSLSMGFVGLAIGLISRTSLPLLMRWVGVGVANGLEATILVLGSMPIVESIFNLSTPGRLLELSNPNQPLMKKLLATAPGTYNHSILVGNIAEAAAQSIGANSLLARVGAYYHDIGKMKRPYFFIENQIYVENPHDNINPRLSSLTITAHVKDGVGLARKNRLPKEIVDIVREHHGTGLVAYFFNKAKETVEKQKVSESDYRYAGSKPKSKEAAIVMVSDSIEAAVRAVEKPTLKKINFIISKMIKGRMEDGQLSDSGLTFEDLEKISKSFEQSLAGAASTRAVAHPDSDEDMKAEESSLGS